MNQPKSLPVAYALWALGFLGLCGLHRLYLGKSGTGVVWFLTLGLFLVGQVIDLFLIPGMVAEADAGTSARSSTVVPVAASTTAAVAVSAAAPSPVGWNKVNNLRVSRPARILRFVQNEEVVEAVEAVFPADGGNSTGCIILMPSRVVLVRLRLFSENSGEFRWEKVSAIGFDRGMLSATITINAGLIIERVQLPLPTRAKWDIIYAAMQRLRDAAAQPTLPATVNVVVAAPAPAQAVREVVVVKVRCAYCAALVDQGVTNCPSCRAKM